MKTNEVLELMDTPDFLDKIYHFSYRRCNTSVEAQDLCSEIILTLISAVHKQFEIGNFYAFVWTVAHRVYADYCEKRKKYASNTSIDEVESSLASTRNEIEAFIEETADREQLQHIFREISFLSKSYRDVMVMYYIDEYKVKDIASHLGISETTVKQRLFSARNTVKREVETMNNRNLSLKPKRLFMIGSGSIVGHDPRLKLERIFSQNLIYLCKDKPKTAKELSEELCVPMPFVEEELEIQCRGDGGFGALRKLENGKYISNVLIVDYEEFCAAAKIYEKSASAFCCMLKNTVKKNREKILSAPFLSPQTDIRFILWAWINYLASAPILGIEELIHTEHFPDVDLPERDYRFAFIAHDDGITPDISSWSCDSISAPEIDGYHNIELCNTYDRKLLHGHFDAGHSMVHDPLLRILFRSIGGLAIDTLSQDEKEIVAKAIECGYLRKCGTNIEPNIVIMHQKDAEDVISLFFPSDDSGLEEMRALLKDIAKELADFIKNHIPKHLIHEHQTYASLIAGQQIESRVIDVCIKEGLLYEPKKTLGGEGILMTVK